MAADPDRLHRHLGGPGGGAHRRHRGAADAAGGADDVAAIDARIIATIAFIAFGVSYLMRANLTADASFLAFMLPLLVQGIAMATFFLAMITILLDGVPPQRIPLASGLSNFRAHHRRRLCRLHRHHLVGPARGAAPEPAGRPDHQLQSRASARRWRALHRLGLPDLGAKASMVRIMTGQAYLLGAERYLLGVGLDLLSPDRHGVALPQGQVGWRRAGCSGLIRCNGLVRCNLVPFIDPHLRGTRASPLPRIFPRHGLRPNGEESRSFASKARLT